MQAELRGLPAGTFTAEDFLDNDGLSERPVKIRVAITVDPRRGRARIDFTGSDPQVAGSVNAVAAITWSAAFYVFRCLLPEAAAPTAGLLRPLEMVIPPGTIVDARPPAAVAGGNVECSQRIVDVLLRALAQAAPERLNCPVEANELFLRASDAEAERLRAQGVDFYEWGPGQIRLVTSWDSDPGAVSQLAAALAAL
jgi:N-methylhydantoinase B/oxoprolinase/acetone carboxylase alpha subunit